MLGWCKSNARHHSEAPLKNHFGNEIGHFVAEGSPDVTVRAQGDRDHRIVEALLHDPRVDAALESDGAQVCQRSWIVRRSRP